MKEEGNNPMVRRKAYYLSNRIENIFDVKKRELQKQFGLVDDSEPISPQDMVDRIKTGKYIIEEKKKYYGWSDGLRWRDPSRKEDQAGFDAANSAMQIAFRDALDTIKIISDEQARLKALKDFEAWTYTPAVAN